MRFINVSGDSPKGVKRRGISRLQVRMHLLSAICVVFLLADSSCWRRGGRSKAVTKCKGPGPWRSPWGTAGIRGEQARQICFHVWVNLEISCSLWTVNLWIVATGWWMTWKGNITRLRCTQNSDGLLIVLCFFCSIVYLRTCATEQRQ